MKEETIVMALSVSLEDIKKTGMTTDELIEEFMNVCADRLKELVQ